MGLFSREKFKSVFSYLYILIGYSNVLFNVLLSVVLIKKLNVSDFGRVSIGRTIFQSFEYSHAGIRYGFDRSLPVCEDEYIKLRLFWSGFYSTFIFSAIFCLFWTFFYYSSSWGFYSFFIIAGFLYALLQLFRIYYRSDGNKSSFVKVSAVSMLLPSIFQLLFFMLWGLWGLLIGFLASYILILVYILIFHKINFISYHKTLFAEFKTLFSQGYILFLTSLLVFCVSSGDRILIERYWGIARVGEYSIIMFIFSILSIFPVNYTELIMSKIVKDKSFPYVLKHVLLLSAVTATLCICSLLILPVVFGYFLPQYLTLFPHMKIVVWAAVPYSMMSLLNYFLHATDNRSYILITNIVSAIAYFVALYFILHFTKNVDYILAAKIIYYILSIMMLFYFCLKISKMNELNTKKVNFE